MSRSRPASPRAPRLPRSAPIPTRTVLRTGPTGLDKVFTATVAAARNPTPAPSAVVPRRVRGIHRRHAAIHAPSVTATSPPPMPPTWRPVEPKAWPSIEPAAPPNPASAHIVTKSKNRCVCVIFSRPQWNMCEAASVRGLRRHLRTRVACNALLDCSPCPAVSRTPCRSKGRLYPKILGPMRGTPSRVPVGNTANQLPRDT